MTTSTTSTTTSTPLPRMRSTAVLFLFLLCWSVAANAAPITHHFPAVRGGRSLKKDDSDKNKDTSAVAPPSPAPQAQTTTTVVESAFVEDEDAPEGFLDDTNQGEGDLEEEEVVEYEDDEEQLNDNQDEEEDNPGQQEDNDKDDKEDKDDEAEIDENGEEGYPVDPYAITFVKLPDIVLEMGVDFAIASRASDAGYTTTTSAGGNDHEAMQALLEHYFETFLPRDVMGTNYVSSELDATMSVVGDNFATTGSGSGSSSSSSLVDFNIKGDAEYQGRPVPNQQELEERLTMYFSSLWGNDDLEAYLGDNGIMGAHVNNVYVKDDQIAGQDSGSGSSLSESNNANANDTNGGGGKPVGLITGLTLFFVCLFASIAILWTTRKETFSECGAWCKTTRQNIREKHIAKRGWHDFPEEGSDTAPVEQDATTSSQDEDEQQQPKVLLRWMSSKFHSFLGEKEKEEQDASAPKRAISGHDEADEQQQPKVLRWLSSKFNSFRREKQEEPSAVLQHVQVVVDNDHVLKQHGHRSRSGYSRNFSTTESSGHQYSAATVPHSNYGGNAFEEDMSPQKTLATLPSDDEELSLEDPIVRYAPPSRAKSPMYADAHHPWKERRTERETGTSSTPATAKSTPLPPPNHCLQMEDEDDEMGVLAEWTSYLNPCIVPNLPMFQYESERLDDLVASLPRDKSLADGDSVHTPPRRSRSRSNGRTRSGRSRSGRSSSKGRTRSGRSSSKGRTRSGRSSSRRRHSSDSRYHPSNREI